MNQLHDQRTQVALKLQRKHKCRALIDKRCQALVYLSRIFNSFYDWDDSSPTNGVVTATAISESVKAPLWMGVYKLSRQTLERFLTEGAIAAYPDRAKQYLSLSVSISKLIDIPPIELSNSAFIKSCLQLFEEWDYNYSSAAVQSVKFMLAKNSSSFTPSVGAIFDGGDSDYADTFQFRPTLYKFNNKVVHEFLLSSKVDYCSHELDFFEAFICLMECLEKLYLRLNHEEYYSLVALYEGVLKVDDWIKQTIIDDITELLDVFAIKNIHENLNDYRSSTLIRPENTMNGRGFLPDMFL